MSIHSRDQDPVGLSRRQLIERCALAAFGLTLLPLGGDLNQALAASAAVPAGPAGFGSAKRIIVLQLEGGLSHVDSFDPKTQGQAKSEVDPLATKAGFQLSGYLPKTAEIAGELAVIRSMAAKSGVHESAQYVMRTGYDQRGTVVHPTLGAWAQHWLGPSHKTLPSCACVNRSSNSGNGFFPASHSPLPILDPDLGLTNTAPKAAGDAQAQRLRLLDDLNKAYEERVPDQQVRAYTAFYEDTLRLMKGEDLKAFDITNERTETRDAYGRNKFGQGCLLARRLVQHGVRFVEVKSGGWDMHKDLDTAMKGTGAQFDQALAALVADLKQRGMFDSTLVAVTTEFGRKPEWDGDGRGHHPGAFSCVLAGAGVKRGYVHGSTDAAGMRPDTNPVSVGALHATIGFAAGLPVEKEFTTEAGRPFTIGNKAKPVMELFA